MEVLCINGEFSGDAVSFWKAHGVVYPEQDKMYTIREVIRHSNGLVGVRLEELINPKVPVNNAIMGVIMLEPSWNANRFAKLDGSPITSEDVHAYQPESTEQTQSKEYLESLQLN